MGYGRTFAWRESGKGPAVVMIHGWSLSGRVFAEIAGKMSSDYRVLMPDLPGHGDSSPASSYSLENLATDLAEWLKAVAPCPLLVCGWSLGGMVAMQMAAGCDAHLQSLALIATSPRFTRGKDWPFGLPAPEVKLLKRNLQRNFQPTLGAFFTRMFTGEGLDTERLRAIRKFAIYPSRLPELDVAQAILQIFSRQDQRQLLAKISNPVMVLHGTSDRITPVQAGRFLAGAIPGAVLKEYAGIGHAPFLSQPKPFVEDLRSFIGWIR